MSKWTFPRLAPDIHTLDCARYLLHVTSFKRAPMQATTRAAKLNFSGKWSTRISKRHPGMLEIVYCGITARLLVTASREVEQFDMARLVETLKCTPMDLSVFLVSKRLRVVGC